jgi:hypothetical protein
MLYGSALLGVGKLTVRTHKEKSDSFLVYFMILRPMGKSRNILHPTNKQASCKAVLSRDKA